MEGNVLPIIVQLIFLEGILSIDNAAVLGAMVLHLPNDQKIVWPRWLAFFDRWSSRMGSQREAALRVGLLGAYAGRALMLILAGMIIQVQWVRVVGAAYLLYLGFEHLGDLYHEQQESGEQGRFVRHMGGFWATVGATILADLAFSVDNVIAAVALSDKLWIVMLGVAIGMVIMRFAANLFSRAISWEPAMETGAYLLLIAIGIELLLKEYAHLEIGEMLQFAISVSILVLTVVFARVVALRRMLIIFRPILALFGALQWVIAHTRALVFSPFRRRTLPPEEA